MTSVLMLYPMVNGQRVIYPCQTVLQGVFQFFTAREIGTDHQYLLLHIVPPFPEEIEQQIIRSPRYCN